MNSTFSEFSYGFALVHEIVNQAGKGLKAAPVFPSLIAEGKPGGGYDVILDHPGNPLFLQFKLCEILTRSNAAEWSLFSKPYYRFWIPGDRRSRQHRFLVDLDTGTNLVYYSAPMFHTIDDLNTCFARKQVMAQSVYFRPRDIGKLPSDDDHPVVFHPDDDFGYRCSEPKKINAAASGEALIGRLFKEIRQMQQEEASDELFNHLADVILEGCQDNTRDLLRVVDNYSPQHKAALLSRIVLGAELVWVAADPLP